LTTQHPSSISVAQLNIEQANINMQKTGAIVDFFSPGALK
ncbi:hypothetical protein OFN18_24085, partial [Escherichia coli]|nr:hypothetical protein [Escherichia coli]